MPETTSVRRLRLLLAALCALAVTFASPWPASAEPAGAGSGPPRLGPPGEDDGAVRAAGAGDWDSPAAIPGALLVTTTDAAAAERVGTHGAALTGRAGLAAAGDERVADTVTRVTVAPGAEAEAAAALRRVPGVIAVEPDLRYEWTRTPNDPRFGEQWAHQQTRIPTAWDRSVGRESVKVAILDSGVDGTHPDLAANIVAQVRVGSLPNGPSSGTVPRNNNDCPPGTRGYNHGTSVAGVAGAVGDNGRGVAGAAWRVGIVDVALIGGSGDDCLGPTDSNVISALNWVARRHPDAAAVNLSFGTHRRDCPQNMQAAIDRVRANGTAVIAASGNDGSFLRFMPAGCDGVIAVGASAEAHPRATYSNRARALDLLAPGGEAGAGVLTTVRTGSGYGRVTGTSFAAPYVAGVVALAQDARDQQGRARLTPAQVETMLERTAVHPDGPRQHDTRHGWGLLDAGQAVRLAASSQSIGQPDPHPLVRWSRPDGRTEPITQAIAVSQALFDGRGARHAVVARSDDYADALAGSALGFGAGPVLFTRRSGSIDARVLNELRRVLPSGGLVYVLGGSEAVDPQVDNDLVRAGYRVRRLAGVTREYTAVEVAREVPRRVAALGWTPNPAMILATRGNWPDAVAAGSLAAVYGVPVVLTPVASLHPATRALLDEAAPESLYVVGGTAAISDAVLAEAVRVSGADTWSRLGGAARDDTAVAVASELEWQLASGGVAPPFGIAINLDRDDAYAYALAASVAAAASGSVFVPVRQAQSGVRLTEAGATYACGLSADVLLPGGHDVLPAGIARELQDLLERAPTQC